MNVGVDTTEVPGRPFREPISLEEAMSILEDKYYTKKADMEKMTRLVNYFLEENKETFEALKDVEDL